MRKVAAVLCAGLLCASAASPEVPARYEHDENAIVLVACQRPQGWLQGSAFKVGPDTYVTAAHVVRDGPCAVDGIRIAVTSLDNAHDYATFIGPKNSAIIRTSCKGFQAGRIYIARGYPAGFNGNIIAPWTAVGATVDGFDIFSGEAIPGMSGGPVINGQGEAVGVVNRRLPSSSMPLKDTGYCG